MRQSLKKIVSGAQTGVDRAALDVALKYKIKCGGWCPKGRIAEDGIIPAHYSLKETPSPEYAVRTEWNVRDSDGTLILNRGKLNGGTAFTVECAKKYKKHFLILDLPTHHVGCGVSKKDKTGLVSFGYNLIVRGWIMANDIRVLNVAGPRESKSPGIYKTAKKFLEKVLDTRP
ncbi:MAG: putative molybdenum carrier protein [Candidatus Ratteibacteria bacterium]|nr:putative molybdenum carrier protein [Candidatus Ratteibacteria bacterium]